MAKRHRDRRPHYVEQHANASGVVEPLERAHEIGKRSEQDSDRLPDDQTGIEERQIGLVPALDEGRHDSLRHGDRTTPTGE
jgi:hypothetical protein